MNLKELTDDISRDIVERAQRNLGATRTVGGKKRRAVASGDLKSSLTYKNRTRYNKPEVIFTTDSDKTKQYADVVEFGRRAGARMPPIAPIKEWVKIKNIRPRSKNGGFIKASESEIDKMVWNIARSIAKNGIKPLYYYTDAIEAVLEERGKEFEDALAQELDAKLNLNGRQK
jgi:hypothetical protein